MTNRTRLPLPETPYKAGHYCNKCGQYGSPTAQHTRPNSGQLCNYLAVQAPRFIDSDMHAYSDAENAALRADQQRKLGALARYRIETQLVDQLLQEGPDTETTSLDMEYWTEQHDQLKAVLQECDTLRERVRVLREVVESAAAADVFKDSPGAMDRLAEYARAALEAK